MADPYTSVTVTNYNLNPPPDDGSQVAANEIKWATHKTKLADPLKAAVESINTNVGNAVDKLVGGAGVTTDSTGATLTASVQGQLVVQTGNGIATTTPSAATVGSPFVFAVLNQGTAANTLEGSGSETVNGAANITIEPEQGVLVYTDGTNWFAIGLTPFASVAQAAARTSTTKALSPATDPLPPGHIHGLTIANGTDATNDINIAAGSARDSTDADNIILASALTKQLDAAWAVGTNAGGLDTGSIADTTYHVFVIKRTDTGVVDALFSTSPTAPTMPADYDYFRRIGSIVRVSAAIKGFSQDGDEFLWTGNPVLDVDAAAPGTSAITTTLTVPTGIVVEALFTGGLISDGNTAGLYFSALVQPDQAVLSASDTSIGSDALPQIPNMAGTEVWNAGTLRIRTNTSAQIRRRNQASSASTRNAVATYGWIDTRGRL